MNNNQIISGEIVEMLFKGATIIYTATDSIKPNNRLLVKMPEGITAEDKRIIYFKEYGMYSDKPGEDNYSIYSDYYINNKRSAINLFRESVREDRLQQFRIKEFKKSKSK